MIYPIFKFWLCPWIWTIHSNKALTVSAQNSLKTDIDRWPVWMVRLIRLTETARRESKPSPRIRRLPRVPERDSGSRSGPPRPRATFRYDPYPSSKHGLFLFFWQVRHRLIRRPATAHRVPSPSPPGRPPPPAITSGGRGHAEPELLRPPRGALPRDRAQAAEGTDRGSRLWKSLRGRLEGALAALSDLLRCRFRAPGLLGFRHFVFCAGDLRLGGSPTVGFRRGFMRIHGRWRLAWGEEWRGEGEG
jgi:hypothetical protein